MAPFIVFEGIDGSGKTTQARALVRRLRRRDVRVIYTREPGGTPIGEHLRRWLKRNPQLSPVAEASVFIAARAQLIKEVIRPALDSGATVVSDRYTPSTVAYQGDGRGLDLLLIRQLNFAATGGLAPELTVLLDLSPDTALARKNNAPLDSIESAPLEFHRRVRESYLRQAAENAEKWLVLDAKQPRAELSKQIWERVRPLG